MYIWVCSSSFLWSQQWGWLGPTTCVPQSDHMSIGCFLRFRILLAPSTHIIKEVYSLSGHPIWPATSFRSCAAQWVMQPDCYLSYVMSVSVFRGPFQVYPPAWFPWVMAAIAVRSGLLPTLALTYTIRYSDPGRVTPWIHTRRFLRPSSCVHQWVQRPKPACPQISKSCPVRELPELVKVILQKLHQDGPQTQLRFMMVIVEARSFLPPVPVLMLTDRYSCLVRWTPADS